MTPGEKPEDAAKPAEAGLGRGAANEAARQLRAAAALRENLKRRKAQGRQRKSAAGEPDGH